MLNSLPSEYSDVFKNLCPISTQLGCFSMKFKHFKSSSWPLLQTYNRAFTQSSISPAVISPVFLNRKLRLLSNTKVKGN